MTNAAEFFAAQDPQFMPFFNYCRSFYGSGGLYPIAGIYDNKIAQACHARIVRLVRSDCDFSGDTTDREIVRDTLIAWSLNDCLAGSWILSRVGTLDLIDRNAMPDYVLAALEKLEV